MFFNTNYSWLEWMIFYDDESDCYEIELIELNPKLKPVERSPSDYTAVITSKDPPESSNLLHLLSSPDLL